MKYCRVVAIVLAAGGVLVACGSGSDTPTDADAACNAALKEHDCVQREDASGQVISGGTADCDSPTKHAGGFSHAWAQSKNVELSSGEFTEISAVYTVSPPRRFCRATKPSTISSGCKIPPTPPRRRSSNRCSVGMRSRAGGFS